VVAVALGQRLQAVAVPLLHFGSEGAKPDVGQPDAAGNIEMRFLTPNRTFRKIRLRWTRKNVDENGALFAPKRLRLVRRQDCGARERSGDGRPVFFRAVARGFGNRLGSAGSRGDGQERHGGEAGDCCPSTGDSAHEAKAGVIGGGIIGWLRTVIKQPLSATGALRSCMGAAAIVLFGVLAAPTAASGQERQSVREVAPGVFVREGAVALMSAGNRGGIANIGFVVGEAAVAVIDTGGSVEDGKALLAAVRDVTDRPVRYVINTHMHPDHVFGNAAFADFAADFVGAARLPMALAAREAHYLAANRSLLGEALSKDIRIVPPTLIVEDELALDLGNRRLLLRTWPAAHTDNDLTILDEATGTLFAGDLVFLEHIPALDGSILGWLEAIDALAAIPAERVVPGHGPVSAPWPQALEPQRRYLNAVATGVRELIGAGESIAEAPARVAPGERSHWKLFDAFHARNVTAAFAELEWE
jgi:quinoprotein relay system zinc metallohydrolase 2